MWPAGTEQLIPLLLTLPYSTLFLKMADKEELKAELTAMEDVLKRTLKADSAPVLAEGRPFDYFGWITGDQLKNKYPAGPPFFVSGKGCNDWENCSQGLPSPCRLLADRTAGMERRLVIGMLSGWA